MNELIYCTYDGGYKVSMMYITPDYKRKYNKSDLRYLFDVNLSDYYTTIEDLRLIFPKADRIIYCEDGYIEVYDKIKQ